MNTAPSDIPIPTVIKVSIYQFFTSKASMLEEVCRENYIEDEVKNQLSHLIDKFHLININIYALKTGRLYQIFIYTDLQNDNTTVTEMDNIRLEITEEITKIYPRNYTDIIFTKIDPNP